MNQLKRIVLLSGNQLCNNPRVIKEADALAQAGYNVVALGANLMQDGKERDNKIMATRNWESRYAFDLNSKSRLVHWIKLQRKLGLVLFKYFGLQNRWQLGYGVDVLIKQSLALKPDLVIAHWEVALAACGVMAGKGISLGVDMEDWFSEDLLPSAQKERPIKLLKKLEKQILCEGVWSTCTSEAMADALVSAYGCRRPQVVRNVFPVKDREKMDGKWKDRPWMVKWLSVNDPKIERPKDAPISIHWFSQTIGPGRGLEQLFQALEGVKELWELHVRGNLKGYEHWLEQSCPTEVKERLRVHEQVENEELLSRIAEHDIGYAGEPKTPPNKDLTISNKLFQYLQSGLAIIASDTRGQIEAAKEAEGAVRLYQAGSVESLRGVLFSLLRNHSQIARMKTDAWKAGSRLSWQNEALKYKELIRRLEHN